MPGKTKTPEPTVEDKEKTSRRGLIGVIIAAIITAVATISAATINSCRDSSPLTFSGRVIDKNTEEKIRGAKVSLEEAEGAPPLAYSDSEGIFSFPVGDPNKELRLRIEANKYQNYDLRATPAKNQGIQEVRLTPKTDETAELSGFVFDRNDKPIQGAKVTLDDVLGISPVETSSDGTFTIRNIPRKYSELVRIRIVKEGFKPNPYTEDVVLGKTPPRIKLTRK